MTDSTTSLGWLFPIPVWAWVIIISTTVALVWWSYRRFDIPTWAAFLLGTLRFTSLCAVLIMLAGPVIETTVRNEVQDRIVVMIDRSRSMSTPDTTDETGGMGSRSSRIRSILGNTGVWDEIGRGRIIEWFGFHDHPFPIDAPQSGSSTLPPESGNGTDITRSIGQLRIGESVNPTAGLIIVSDGRSRSRSTWDTTSSLRSSGIPIHTVLIGPSGETRNMGIGSVNQPGTAFAGDIIPVVVDVTNPGNASPDAELVLRDSDSGTVLDRRKIEPDRNEYTLVGESSVDGEAYWTVEITPPPDDSDVTDDSRDITIRITDEPLRVLYVDGYPRWEFRYLKNLLIREKSITSSILLLSADGDYAQEGDRPIRRLPLTPEEFRDFDVMIIGDVPSSTLSTEQQELVEQLVVDGELGILWIGGPSWTPSDWRGDPIESIIPFTPFADPVRSDLPVHMVPTDDAVQMGILRIDDGTDGPWAVDLGDPSNPWSALQWYQVINRDLVRPTTRVLAESVETFGSSGLHHPLVLMMRYGAGRSIYCATDEIWRWRHGRGERLYEQFWIPLIRSTIRSDRLDGDPFVIDLVPDQVQIGRPQRIRLTVNDADLIDDLGEIIPLRLESDSGSRRRAELMRESGSSRTWSTTWVPDEPGRWTVLPLDDSISPSASCETTVFDRSGEMSNTGTDHDFLRRISRETGGITVSPDDLSGLLDVIPDRSIISTSTLRNPLWNRWWMFCIPILILGMEWMGRRLFRLS